MTALPNISQATDSAATEGDFKNFITSQHSYLSGLFGTSGDKPASRASLQVPLHSKADKSGAYTVVAADQGRVLNCAGTWTLSLTSAATLGDGFLVAVLNSGSGAITIDPAGTETIDGATTKPVIANGLAIIYCNGTAFFTVGSIYAETIATALGYTPARTDHTHDFSASFVGKDMAPLAVGMIAYCYSETGWNISPGNTVSGATISIGGATVSYGTWKNIGPATVNQGDYGMFQRTV